MQSTVQIINVITRPLSCSFQSHQTFVDITNHPWAGEDLSLKIDEHDQTIRDCILES